MKLVQAIALVACLLGFGSQGTRGVADNKSSFVVVYHRSPFDEVTDAEGNRSWQDHKSPNGIIPTLRNLFQDHPSGRSLPASGTWIASRQDEKDNAADEIEVLHPIRLRRIPLQQRQISSFYHVTSKEALWPILHTFPRHFNVDNANWTTFQEVNRLFAEAACSEAAPGAIIWVHDYNLWLAPGYIREQRPDVKILFFHHTPFPDTDAFGILPWREEIISSLLACDVVGFHIPRYVENFSRAVSSLRNIEMGPRKSVSPHFLRHGSALAQPDVAPWLRFQGRTVRLVSTPVGTSPDLIRARRDSEPVQSLVYDIERNIKNGRKLIISASRVDYTKGNEELLLAYERLLERRPDIRGDVVLMLVCVAANAGMKVYQSTQRSIEESVDRINSRYGRIDWVPIRLKTQRNSYEEMVAWYAAADICWITPLRDGLNIVAKEYVAARKGRGGSLVLSEFAGASAVVDGAILTNPYSNRSMDEAIDTALLMPVEEQRARMKRMGRAVDTLSVANWANVQLEALEALTSQESQTRQYKEFGYNRTRPVVISNPAGKFEFPNPVMSVFVTLVCVGFATAVSYM